MFDALPAGDPSRFRPRTLRQFLILHIATRLGDLRNLNRYLNAGAIVDRQQLLDCARHAEEETLANGRHAADAFWHLIHAGRKEVI